MLSNRTVGIVAFFTCLLAIMVAQSTWALEKGTGMIKTKSLFSGGETKDHIPYLGFLYVTPEVSFWVQFISLILIAIISAGVSIDTLFNKDGGHLKIANRISKSI